MGWQERYFELQNGVLVYYKSESEKQFGSRGSITLRCANLQENEEDSTHFGITTNGVAWYLKAESLKSKNLWLQAIKTSPSAYYVTSSTFFFIITFKDELKAKVDDLEKSRQLARFQVEKLQQKLNSAVQQVGSNAESSSLQEEGLALDMTTAAILRDVKICIDILSEQVIGFLVLNSLNLPVNKVNSKEEPIDQEEDDNNGIGSPTSASSTGILSDSEWHDALEMKEDNIIETVLLKCGENGKIFGWAPLFYLQDARLCKPKIDSKVRGDDNETHSSFSPFGVLTLPSSCPLAEEINRITLEQLRYAKAGVEENASFIIIDHIKLVWELFSEEGEMRMYKMEMEIEGLVCDPLKATHCVKGVTAREYIHFFYEPEYKEEWDETIDKMNVVETISSDTCVIHQVILGLLTEWFITHEFILALFKIHKRIWPAAQRESLFWSHVRKLNSSKDSDAYDLYIVCNHDTQRADVPLTNLSNIRVGVTVAMVCQTIINRRGHSEEITRDDVQCRIIYVAQVHPGGWVPSGALRVVYKREYPKFLRGFTSYVVQQLTNRPLCL
ncbi:unnamed protein product [Enterobius vermicularis]|uniref:PH domain-containing protein n=1 Tax=Enterobius vermicularis TaxID=51028 RepID=A0A0N4VCK5_ENTVE|nr:unnamed protein product [Enterobius vermicularis]